MVIRLVLIVFFIGIHAVLLGDTVKINAEIETYGAYENQPLKGTIMVTHNQNSKIDGASFRLDKKSIEVKFVKDVKFEPNNPLIISIYGFDIPGKPAGLYLLPSVSVKVDGKEYSSAQTSYEITAKNNAMAPTVPSAIPGGSNSRVPLAVQRLDGQLPALPSKENSIPGLPEPFLHLEAFVDGKKELFPGQRTRLVYRYNFNGNIDLTTEQLPLLDAKGFIKIGEKEIRDYSQGNVSISEISQEVEAKGPGEFSFGPSLIQGNAYQIDAYGKHQPSSPKLVSEASAVTLTVLPFPDKEKPGSFNGAVGEFTFKVGLESSDKMHVGDEILLKIEIAGKDNIRSVPLPEICCQPGFSGFFQISDLPPEEEVQGDTKKAIFKLHPLHSGIQEIPSIEFSFFNPTTTSYQIIRSQPIPISVSAFNSEKPVKGPIPEIPKSEAWSKKQDGGVSPIEISGIFLLRATDLYNKIFGTWWAFAIIPLGIAFLIYQMSLRNYLVTQEQVVSIRSAKDIFDQAVQQEKGSSRYYELIIQALKIALVESREVDSEDVSLESLPKIGVSGEVRDLLSRIEEGRFAGISKEFNPSIEIEALSLIKKILATMNQKKGAL